MRTWQKGLINMRKDHDGWIDAFSEFDTRGIDWKSYV